MPTVGAAPRLGAGYFLLFSAVAVVAPHLQVLLRALGFGKAAVGALLGAYEVSAIAGAMIFGRVADLTRRTSLVIQLCTTAAALSLLALGRFGSGRPAVALACMVGAGLTFKCSGSLTDALSSRVLRDSHQYGRVRAFGTIGFILVSLGVQAGGLIRADDSGAIVSAAVAACALWIACAFFLPAPGPVAAPLPGSGARSGERVLLTLPFVAFLAMAFLTSLGSSAHYSFFSLFLTEKFGLATVSGIWALGAIAEIPMIFFSGAFLRRFGIRAMLVAAAAAVTLRMLLYALAPGLGLVIAAQALHVLTFGAFHTACIAAVRRLVPPRHQGIGMAVYGGLSSGAALLAGSVLGGLILEHAPGDAFRTLYLVAAVPPALAALLALTAARRLDAPGP